VAIRFSPRLGGAACPVILAEQCTGCGDCVTVCPASAITLAGQTG
jgi:ferredoxin-type protein NapF